MYHVVHLIVFFFLAGTKKVCWTFVSKWLKLVERINLLGTAFKKISCLSQTSKTIIFWPYTPELKSISKFRILSHWKNFEKYMIFYTLPRSRGNRTHKLWNTSLVLFEIAKLGQTWLVAPPILKYEPLNSCITIRIVWIMKIFQCYTFSGNKRQNYGRSKCLKVPLFDLKRSNVMFRCQNLIGSWASTHSTCNLIRRGPTLVPLFYENRSEFSLLIYFKRKKIPSWSLGIGLDKCYFFQYPDIRPATVANILSE